MGATSLKRAVGNLTVAAKKVYDSVPLAEAWAVTQIHNEIARQGHNLVRTLVEGCLQSLKDDGLVKEPKRGFFVKTPIKEKTYEPPTLMEFADTSIKAPKLSVVKAKEPPMVLTSLSPFIEKFRDLAKEANALADQLEEAVLKLDDDVKQNSEAATKLAQLQSLLKGI